jgi:hypothetical protein
MTGVMIADRVVLFSKTSEPLSDRIVITLEGDGLLKILVTDLTPGLWEIEKSGEKVIKSYRVNPEGHALYFVGKPGKYSLSRID